MIAGRGNPAASTMGRIAASGMKTWLRPIPSSGTPATSRGNRTCRLESVVRIRFSIESFRFRSDNAYPSTVVARSPVDANEPELVTLVSTL